MKTLRIVLPYFCTCLMIVGCSQPAEEAAAPEAPAETASVPAETIIERADRLEVDTDYVAPPGDPMAHHTMGFARTLCSAVFVS